MQFYAITTTATTCSLQQHWTILLLSWDDNLREGFSSFVARSLCSGKLASGNARRWVSALARKIGSKRQPNRGSRSVLLLAFWCAAALNNITQWKNTKIPRNQILSPLPFWAQFTSLQWSQRSGPEKSSSFRWKSEAMKERAGAITHNSIFAN